LEEANRRLGYEYIEYIEYIFNSKVEFHRDWASLLLPLVSSPLAGKMS
jgi:hypothetical protein